MEIWVRFKMMKQIKSEPELLGLLFSDIDNCQKRKIVLLGGHFPLRYIKDGAVEALDYWGEFSKYTLELACKLGEYAKRRGKQVAFVFFVDDHMYEEMNNLTNSQVSLMRNRLYKLRSGPDAKLPKPYREVMGEYGFSEAEVIRQNQGKRGRESCLYFSEKILRASKRAIDNPCAREYIEFLEDESYFNKASSYIIAFIPQRCRENICNSALDIEVKGINGSHVFIETMTKLATREQLYVSGRGVSYRRD